MVEVIMGAVAIAVCLVNAIVFVSGVVFWFDAVGRERERRMGAERELERFRLRMVQRGFAKWVLNSDTGDIVFEFSDGSRRSKEIVNEKQ